MWQNRHFSDKRHIQKKNKFGSEKDYVQKSILSKTCDKVDKMW